MKCPHCNKTFKNAASCAQHQEMVHSTFKKSVGQTGRRRRPRRARNGPGGLSTDLAPSRIPAPRGGSITVSGEDRLGAYDVKKQTAVFLNIDINASVTARLESLSRAYQRIKWNSVRVIVTPQAATIINGGYVAGFIMDPSDRAITARDLSASQGSQTKKWYESVSVAMPRKPDLLYTSPGEDPRLATPSTFWLIGEGLSSSDLTVILTIVWNVTLSVPTVEDMSATSFTLSGELKGKDANWNLEYLPPGGKATDDFSSQIPAALKAKTGRHFFRVPTFLIEVYYGVGDTGTMQCHFIAYDTSDKKVYYSQDGKTVSQKPWQSGVETQVVVSCGTYCKYVGMGNECRTVASSQPLPSSDGDASLEDWTQFSSRLEKMERSLRELRNFSHQNSQNSNPKLMNEQDFEVL